jgi:hypothetical protein
MVMRMRIRMYACSPEPYLSDIPVLPHIQSDHDGACSSNDGDAPGTMMCQERPAKEVRVVQDRHGWQATEFGQWRALVKPTRLGQEITDGSESPRCRESP